MRILLLQSLSYVSWYFISNKDLFTCILYTTEVNKGETKSVRPLLSITVRGDLPTSDVEILTFAISSSADLIGFPSKGRLECGYSSTKSLLFCLLTQLLGYGCK